MISINVIRSQMLPIRRVILLVKKDCLLYHAEGNEVERVCFTYEGNESKVETKETPIAINGCRYQMHGVEEGIIHGS